MIQARLSSSFLAVFTWIAIISLTFGFCASWCLHFVGMQSCKLDLPVGLDVGLTLFSAVLAVTFTFAALGAELLWERYNSNKRRITPNRQLNSLAADDLGSQTENSSTPLLGRDSTDSHVSGNGVNREPDFESDQIVALPQSGVLPTVGSWGMPKPHLRLHDEFRRHASNPSRLMLMSPSEPSDSEPPQGLRIGSAQLDLKNMADHRTVPTKNAFVATYEGILNGMSLKAAVMGLVWSLSLTCMHYGGLLAMNIPAGYLTFNTVLVIISAIISWVVCTAGYIYMVNIEPHLSQQALFSAIAASGIAAMHFTGTMRCTIRTHT